MAAIISNNLDFKTLFKMLDSIYYIPMTLEVITNGSY